MYVFSCILKRCISSLLVDRPSDPITYMIDYLKKDSDGELNRFRVLCFVLICILVPKIIILGPPASGRHTIGKLLQKKLGTILIEPEEVLRDAPSKLKDKLLANSNIVCDFEVHRKYFNFICRIIFHRQYGLNYMKNV